MSKSIVLALLVAVPTLNAADAVVKLVVGSASHTANASVPSGRTFSTGKKSRSELALEGGTVRTGSDTSLHVSSANAVTLQKGIALVASKPKLFRGSVQVSTPGHDMKVRGTAQIYYDPGHSVRVVALEGSVTVSLNSVRGEQLTLKRGQELIINPVDKQLPTPVEVDLNRLMSTMALLNQAHFTPLPSASHIEVCAQKQEAELESGGELDATPVMMSGASSEIELLPEEIVHEEASDEIDDLDGDGEPDPAMTLDEDGVPVDETNTDTTDNADNADDNTDNADNTEDTTDDGTRRVRRRRPAAPRGKSVTVSISNQRISGNQVTLGSSTKPVRIQIANSSEVAAIAGALHALGNGGNIFVDTSTLRATGEILLDTGATTRGLIQLKNATLSADAIRARAFSTGGDALIIDGSTLSAAQLIKLYGEGIGTVRFRNNVTLDTNQAIIAGKTVEVDAGGNVNVRGKADIYTDNANFNRAGYGNINAGGGVTTHPHAGRPGF